MVKSYKCVLFDLDNTLLKKSPHVVEKVYEYVSVISSSISEEEVRKAYAESELWTGEQIMDETEKGYQMPDDESSHAWISLWISVLRSCIRMTLSGIVSTGNVYRWFRGCAIL